MRNALIYRFDAYRQESLRGFKELEGEGDIRVRLHFTAFETDPEFEDAESIPHDFYFRFDDFDEGKARIEKYAEYEYLFPEFQELLSRHYVETGGYRTLASYRSLFSDRDLFYRLISFYLNRLETYQIDLVVFDEIPHFGGSWLCYKIAQSLNIQCVLFLQSVVRERCLCVETIEQLGHLDDRPDLTNEPLNFDWEEPDVAGWYMKRDQPNATQARLETLTQDIYSHWFEGFTEFREIIENHPEHKKFVREYLLAKWLPNGEKYEKRYLQRLEQFYNERQLDVIQAELNQLNHVTGRLQSIEANEGYIATVENEPDFESDFALFALHYQPELTTQPLGGRFGDQIRAVEELARILPESMTLFVKDHPMDQGVVRGRDFYRRLAQIDNVKLIPTELNSIALIKKAKWVATITGSMGLEAILRGVPAITFGYAWYNGLPGVFRFEDLELEAICNCAIDKAQLKSEIENRARKLANVVAEWGLKDEHLPESFDPGKNACEFKKLLRNLLAQDVPARRSA